MRYVTTLLIVAGVATAAFGRADDRPRADPPTTPLELRITGQPTYTLDIGRLSGAAYRSKIERAVSVVGGRPIAPPDVELVVEMRNTSDAPVRVWVKGDDVVLDLALTGAGAVNVEPQVFFTAEYRMPQAIDLRPGEVYPIPVKELGSGFRGVSRCSYWTEPGEYTLTAVLRTGVRPAPRGSEEGDDGFGLVTLTSAPLRIKVERDR